MLALALILLLAMSQPLSTSVSAQAATCPDSVPAVLAPGDLMRITVWRQPEMSGEFLVAADGSITHPLYRELHVAGQPLPQVESSLREFLKRFETAPAFTLTPLLRVIVGGEVRQPTVLTVPVRTTVGQAIALAGGPSERARLERVRLLRNNCTRTLDLTSTDQRSARLEVRSGDQILVPRRRNLLQDYLGPVASVVAAIGSIATIIIQTSK